MAYKPATRRHATKRIEMEYDGDTLWIEYRPKSVTGAALDESFGETRMHRGNARLIPHMVAAWEVENEDGTLAEPTFENALLYEPEFVAAVLHAITGDMRPNGVSGNGSFSG